MKNNKENLTKINNQLINIVVSVKLLEKTIKMANIELMKLDYYYLEGKVDIIDKNIKVGDFGFAYMYKNGKKYKIRLFKMINKNYFTQII